MPPLCVQRIDFSTTELAENYTGFYAVILDNVFTAEECTKLIDTALSAPGGWQPAGLNLETNQAVSKGFRDNDRVLIDDPALAATIFDRVRPLLDPELLEIGPGSKWEVVTGKTNQKWGGPHTAGVWRARRLNERLRFLRYGPGHFFKPHCDGLNDFRDGDRVLKSFITFHLYLNDSSTTEGLEGGATRFWTPNKKHFLDVEPKIGRVLVFQQRMLVHSGEPVTGGVKYTVRTDLMFEKIVTEKTKSTVAVEAP